MPLNYGHTPGHVVKYARTLIGRPWRHQGRGLSPNGAIDCVGLLILVAQGLDLPYEDVTGYRREGGKELVQYLYSLTDKNNKNRPVGGSIGIFSDGAMPAHVGIFTADNTVIHAESFPKRRVVEENYGNFPGSLSKKLITTRLFRGITYG